MDVVCARLNDHSRSRCQSVNVLSIIKKPGSLRKYQPLSCYNSDKHKPCSVNFFRGNITENVKSRKCFNRPPYPINASALPGESLNLLLLRDMSATVAVSY